MLLFKLPNILFLFLKCFFFIPLILNFFFFLLLFLFNILFFLLFRLLILFLLRISWWLHLFIISTSCLIQKFLLKKFDYLGFLIRSETDILTRHSKPTPPSKEKALFWIIIILDYLKQIKFLNIRVCILID